MTEVETFEQSVERHSKECDELLIDKQKDYGAGNITKFEEFGILVRASDKIERLKNLLENGREPTNETLRDSWMDLRNYGQIALMLMDGEFELPLEEELDSE